MPFAKKNLVAMTQGHQQPTINTPPGVSGFLVLLIWILGYTAHTMEAPAALRSYSSIGILHLVFVIGKFVQGIVGFFFFKYGAILLSSIPARLSVSQYWVVCKYMVVFMVSVSIWAVLRPL